MGKSAYVFLLVTLCFAGLKQQVFGQIDPHFTQNYMFPMAVNPALTGAMDGGYRVSSVFRNQWANISNPYRTIGVSAEFAVGKNINIGASFFKQKAGDSGYECSLPSITLSYGGVRFGPTGDQQISFGAQGGLVNYKFDANGLKFGQQWLPGAGYVPELSSGENIENYSSFLPDVSFGLAYLDKTPKKKIALFGGFSVYHVTQPSFSFLGNQNNNKLPMRISMQAGFKLMVSEDVYLVPNVLYNKQQKASELIASTYAQFYVNEDIDFMLGGNIRIKDAVSPFVGMYFKGLIVGLSYDVNTGPLTTNAPNSNAFEISISFSGGKARVPNSEYFNCPRF